MSNQSPPPHRPPDRPRNPEDRPPPLHGSSRDGRRALGALGEELAAEHYRRLGFVVVARNVRSRHGEIDLIACDGHTLVFAEVKTRRASPRRRGVCPHDQPLAGLRFDQRRRLRALATAWLAERGRSRPRTADIRFDAVGVIVDGAGRLLRLDHLENAW
jgi:putative endonuclease